MTEQARHEAFENLCGGPRRAFALKAVYTRAQQARSGDRFRLRPAPSLAETFRRMAIRDGFTPAEVQAYLAL